MPVQWIAFLASVLVAYIGISIFAQLSSGAITPLSAFFSTLRPLPFFVVTIANMFFGLGIYYGFGLTRFAIPIAISMGVLTSFIYSIVMLGATITVSKIVGALLVLCGIAVMALS